MPELTMLKQPEDTGFGITSPAREDKLKTSVFRLFEHRLPLNRPLLGCDTKLGLTPFKTD